MPHDHPDIRLQDLFITDACQDCFAALSESLGFALSVISREGKLLYGPHDTGTLCTRLRTFAPALVTSCEKHCQPFLENALAAGKPDVFKCYLKYVSFVVPIQYKAEYAVVLGLGSFSSLADYKAGRKYLRAAGLDVTSMTAPTTFTSYPKAWTACDFTSDAVLRLLSNHRKDRTLGNAFESLKKFIGGKGMPTGSPFLSAI